MCLGCFHEYLADPDVGPTPVSDAARVGAALVQALYEYEWSGAGGAAHVVVEDWNIEDHFVQGCLDHEADWYAEKASPDERALCRAVLEHFASMSVADRNNALALEGNMVADDGTSLYADEE